MSIFTLAAIEAANKGTLRSMCRDNGIAATSLNVDAMREALRTLASDYVPNLANAADAVVHAEMLANEAASQGAGENASDEAAAHAAADAEIAAVVQPFVEAIDGIELPNVVPADVAAVLTAADIVAALPTSMQSAAAALFAATKPAKVEKVRTPREPRDESNGVKRPAANTLCGRVWSWCDTQVSQGVRPEAKTLRAALADIDPTTCTVQYYRWRKFNGITGR